MTDLETLHHLVFQQTGTAQQTLSKLGYFCAPFQPDTGPFSDKVIKVYQHMATFTAELDSSLRLGLASLQDRLRSKSALIPFTLYLIP